MAQKESIVYNRHHIPCAAMHAGDFRGRAALNEALTSALPFESLGPELLFYAQVNRWLAGNLWDGKVGRLSAGRVILRKKYTKPSCISRGSASLVPHAGNDHTRR
jgi:hypothetical protein